MTRTSDIRSLWARAARRLRRDERGATAVEFAMIAPYFFGFLMAFYDAGFFMLRQTMLHAAVDKTVRELRVQPQSRPIQDFVDDICDEAIVLGSDCQNRLVVELYPIDTNGAGYPTTTAPCAAVVPSGYVRPATRFDPSQPQRLVFLRACMLVDPIIPGIPFTMGLVDDNGDVKLVSTSAYMSEG